jgi:hypothetical protein
LRWSAADLEQLARRGIAPEEAERQLALLRNPPPPARLARPATAGDGIERLSPARFARLVALGEQARDAGRLAKFVPASGAATRMFKALGAAREKYPDAQLAALRAAAAAGDADARDAAAFVAALPRLALARPLAGALGVALAELLERSARAPLAPLFDALLAPRGLDALALPKALLPFHLRGERAVTAFEEQLDEGLGFLLDRARRARYAFTVPPGARARFEEALACWRDRRPEVEAEVSLSEQSPSSDALALDQRGEPARRGDGRLLFRPAGHGALLANLEATGADLVLVKNIDNVLPAERHAEIARTKLALAGRLVELERAARGDRPLRVVGVVPNAGEPGGGPFWVEGAGGGAPPGPTLQIVEAAQVAMDDPTQAEIWRAATHFHPVDLALALRDRSGAPFRLADFVDPAASLVSRKSESGRELTVLERPGLWNGAMAGWETVLVELPAGTFAPVKSVLDLARPEHAAGAAPS